MYERPAGLRLPATAIRDERLRIAAEMLALTLKETALLPVREQERVRQAVQALQEVRQWCRVHKNTGDWS